MQSRVGAVLGLMLAAAGVGAQQQPDRDFRPPVETPSHATEKGPAVCLDEAHHNFHTLDGRFLAFGRLLEADGYRVRPLRSVFTAAALADCDLLVSANALAAESDTHDSPPYPTPAAFSDAEIEVVRQFVEDGRALLLIADHMPFAGAAASLAARFEVRFHDGFAMAGHEKHDAKALQAALARQTLFKSADGTLLAHAISGGIHQARSFTGQAFEVPDQAQVLLRLPDGFVQLLPREMWKFESDTPRQEVGGWAQGAVLEHGKGRAAFFGEAAMFSAQVAGPDRAPMGMNAPGAEQNARFVLQLVGWLTE